MHIATQFGRIQCCIIFCYWAVFTFNKFFNQIFNCWVATETQMAPISRYKSIFSENVPQITSFADIIGILLNIYFLECPLERQINKGAKSATFVQVASLFWLISHKITLLRFLSIHLKTKSLRTILNEEKDSGNYNDHDGIFEIWNRTDMIMLMLM